MNSIDTVVFNFSEENLFLLNISLGFIMFGVAINLIPEDFLRMVRSPKPVLGGVLSQFLFLPFLFVWIIWPIPSMALENDARCCLSRGNISNFMSSWQEETWLYL